MKNLKGQHSLVVGSAVLAINCYFGQHKPASVYQLDSISYFYDKRESLSRWHIEVTSKISYAVSVVTKYNRSGHPTRSRVETVFVNDNRTEF